MRVNLLLRRRDAALAGIEKQRNHHVQADKQRQTREQANLNRLQVCVIIDVMLLFDWLILFQRFENDAMQSNLKFEREQLATRGAQQVQRRYNLFISI